MVENHLALEVSLFYGSWCLIDRFKMGGIFRIWHRLGNTFHGHRACPSFVRTKLTMFSDRGRAVTVQILHKELTNFVMGIGELYNFFNVRTSRDTWFPILSRRLVFLKITPYQLWFFQQEDQLWNPLTPAHYLLSPCTAIYWVYFNTNTVFVYCLTK